jgi:hypothetical protein
MTPNEWILGRDTGTSSKTIWAVMTGSTCRDPGRPYDADDFGRCYRLLTLFPGWRVRLSEVTAQFPMWTPLVEAWDDLTALYEGGKFRELYDRIRSMEDEIMRLDGWTKTGSGSWNKKNGASSVRLGEHMTATFGK